MIARKMAFLAGAMSLSLAASASECRSNNAFVFLRPETSSFWNTATGSTMTVPVDFPKGASAARLTVKGVGYSREYEVGAVSTFTFELPDPDGPEKENVYDLSLTFDDGTIRTAKLGLIQGLKSGPNGSTRCLASDGGNGWHRARKRAVFPVPCGTRAIFVDGVEIDPGLNGAQGWYALPVSGGERISLSFLADGLSGSALLHGVDSGMMVFVK